MCIRDSPVIVRKILGQLKKAGIVEVARGSGGAVLAKPENDITDVYKRQLLISIVVRV